MNMKLRTKIFGGFLSIFLLAVILGGFGLYTVTQVNNMQQEMQLLTELNDAVDDLVIAHHVWRYNLAYAFLFDGTFTGGLNPHTCSYGQWLDSDLPHAIDDAELRRLIADVFQPHYDLHVQGAEALRLREEGLMDEAMHLLSTVVFPAGVTSTINISALGLRYEYLRDIQVAALDAFVTRQLMIITALFAVSFIVFLLMSGLITKSILSPIKKLVALVSDVTRGKLAVNMNRGNLVNDEIGMLTRDTYDLVDVLKNIMGDLSQINHQFNVVGDIDYRADSSKYQHSFKEVVDSVNMVLDNQVKDVMGTLNVLNQIVDGDFNVQTEDLPGKKSILPQTLLTVTANIKEVYDSIIKLAEEASEGHLHINVDATKFKGDWADLVETLNKLMRAIVEPLDKIKENVTLMSTGDFSNLQGEFKGEFEEVKNACNLTNETTSTYIGEITEVLERMAQGDLTPVIHRNYIGSYAPIKAALLRILDSLNTSIAGIYSSSDQVLAGSQQLSEGAAHLAEGTYKQTEAIRELTDSMLIIDQNVKDSASSASHATESVARSNAFAKEGEEIVGKMLVSMDNLKESSDEISKIIKIISDIAFQTNLLALNASVEAARAGEHGRGFSVVAEEVRNLAGKSQESANDTAASIEKDKQYAEEGIVSAKSVAASFERISSDISGISDTIAQMAEMSRAQVESIDVVNSSVAKISKVVTENSAAAEESSAASDELSSQAATLRELISFFKIR